MKVLIVRIGAMGDVLHALPAVAALRAAQPDATIDWLVDERWLPFLNDLAHTGPIVNTAIPVAIRGWKQAPFAPATLRDFLSYRRLRRHNYDCIVDMQGTLRSAGLGRLAASPKQHPASDQPQNRVPQVSLLRPGTERLPTLHGFSGYADPREALAANLYRNHIVRRGVHVVDQGAALLGDALGLPLVPIAPELPQEQWADDWAAERTTGRRVAVLSPTSGWAAKCWPLDRFAALAQQLSERGYDVLVNAPRQDDAPANELVAASRGAASLALCNPTGLIALMRRAALVVGGDSGPVHLAAALGIPVVALFGPTDPARNGPWGPGPKQVLRNAASVTSYKHTATPDQGLVRIPVEAVVAAVEGVLSKE